MIHSTLVDVIAGVVITCSTDHSCVSVSVVVLLAVVDIDASNVDVASNTAGTDTDTEIAARMQVE